VALHRLASVTVGIPHTEPVAQFYEEFGLTRSGPTTLSTTDGGEQLMLVCAPTRRLVQIVVGVDDEDDLARAMASIRAVDHEVVASPGAITTTEPNSQVRIVLEVMPRASTPSHVAPPGYNGPGAPTRVNERAPGVLRTGPVRPRKLGHVVFTTPNFAATNDFLTSQVGFKVSDYAGDLGAFLRCSTDHHNVLVLEAPFAFLHHTAWQVDDVDEVGRGASALIEGHPERHVWGLGRHHAGSNLFWYQRDPAGNFSEYYSDLDFIPDDASWLPERADGKYALWNWGPEPPSSFLQPDDLMEFAERQQSVGV